MKAWVNDLNRPFGILYAIRCSANSHTYFGSSINPRKRQGQHFSQLNRGVHPNPHLQAAWKSHGRDAFQFEILAVVEPNREAILATESRLLRAARAGGDRLFNARVVAVGPPENVNRGRHSWNKGKPFSAESRKKMSDAATARDRKPCTPATRAKISAAHTGKTLTAEHRAALRGTRAPMSAEARALRSQRLKGRPWSAPRRAAHDRRSAC